MVEQVEIEPIGPFDASVRPPGSKSLTNRALVCAALAEGASRLTGALDSEDTQVMVAALRRLGFDIRHDVDRQCVDVAGLGGRVGRASAELFVGNSGTTIRFLSAMLAACRGSFRLDGVPRMRQRPIGHLVAALRDLGGGIASELGNDCPPVCIEAEGLDGGEARIRGDVSSQFLSGLLLAAPYARRETRLTVEGPLVSQPYVRMTLGVMRQFGVTVEVDAWRAFRIAGPQVYRGCAFDVEPDASAASYFWAAAAIAGGRVRVEGLTRQALQGDVAFCDCLRQMGCEVSESPQGMTVVGRPLRGISVDMNGISDTVQTLAAVALFAEGPTTITGVAHIRHKETDRITDLARELRKLGAAVEELDDGLRIVPGALHGAAIQTYNDHRMAMSLALVGLRVPGVIITDPGCTRKTYPAFFDDLASLTGRIP